MHNKYTYTLFTFLFFFCLVSSAQYISRPEIVGFNGGGHNFCQNTTLRLKFDAENFNAGNVFTVQLSAPNGNFNPTTLMVGSLTATNGQNQFIDVTFPATVQAGNNYRLRIVGSNPFFIGNEPNEFPFGVSVLPVYDPNVYGIDEWRAYVHTWETTLPSPLSPANANLVNFFPENRRAGYFTFECLDFDFNWGTGRMPGNIVPANRNFVCGSYTDFYAIRFKRKFNFEAGNYRFMIGGDDGVRLSIDGGATWLLNDWSEHPFRRDSTGPGGVFLAGERELVVDFFEARIDARVQFRCRRVGSSALVDPPVVFPAELTNITVCNGAPPFSFNGVTPGGGQFSGSGITPGGLFTPGFFTNPPTSTTITYTVGAAGCIRSGSTIINIVEGAVATLNFDKVVCQNANPVLLSASIPGGQFTGSGVSGNVFNPAIAGVGKHAINYKIEGGGACPVDVTDSITVQASPTANLVSSAQEVCEGGNPITLTATPNGGIFFGSAGVVESTFNPSGLAPGTYRVFYRVTEGICSDTADVSITVNPLPNAAFATLPSSFCSDAGSVLLSPVVEGGIFTAPSGVTNNVFNPSQASLGLLTITYTLTINGCTSSTSQTVNIIDATPLPTPTINSLAPAVCSDAEPIALSASPAGGTFSGSGVVGTQFFPNQAQIGENNISYTLSSDNSCVNDVSTSININVIAAPVADAGETLLIEEGKSGVLNGTTNAPGATFNWSPSTGLSNPNVANPTVTALDNTLYTLTVTDFTGTCLASDTVSVKVFAPLFIPNLITTNNDGKNDIWDIKGLKSFPNCKIEVYNRWGRRIFSSTGYAIPWKPDKISPGTYFFTISRFEGDLLKGTLSIVD
jgi:gliding motility-associated-like protein